MASWVSKHAAKFAPDKFELIHFNNPKPTTTKPKPTTTTITTITTNEASPRGTYIWEVPDDPSGHNGMPVIIPGDIPTILASSNITKYLEDAYEGGRQSRGTPRNLRVHLGVITDRDAAGIPGSHHSTDAMGTLCVVLPSCKSDAKRESRQAHQRIDKDTERAAILISGAFRGTAEAALDIELYILPIKLRLQQIVEETTIRILTGPQWACPQTAKEARKLRERKLGGWSPTEAITWKTLQLQYEKWEEKSKESSAAWCGDGSCDGSGTGEPIIRLAVAAKRAIRQRIGERWEKQWERETTSVPTKRLVQAPNKKTLRLYEELSKPQCAILIQMRTMRIGLRHFLFKIKAAETDRYNCDEGSQTPKHILMQCPRYVILRIRLWEQLDGIRIGFMERDYDKIMSNPQAIRYVVNFMHRTGLLQQFQHVGIEEDNDDDDEPTGLAAMDLGVEDDGY
ncbi:hypothetical protein PENSOL_c101G11239 [Penicillium solitum]|uniref:Uncharacterized protein n=1 Tax=Penicillium solitum TaxID=60172 RepID=A0A1V6Q968_9EURO|nr:uncharacterized protein PENSOL_c101G11239 [Penicillium solitum]OQD85542.1 hypothetical protein PENSOL_c101G11239 [Penicillium solitum]